MSFVPRTASVVVPCYNYGRFLGDAIESALGQGPSVRDVVVVDDGSTDDSREVVRRYGDRVLGVLKENGGHASAMNAGIRVAGGDLVFLLDADDQLCPGAVDTVLAAWRPDTVLLHCRPRLVDGDGREIPGTVPAPWVPLDEGDVRGRMLASGWFATTVTSGLVFRRDALARVLPIPEGPFAQGADGYLVRAVAFLGPVQALDRPLARYRRHGSNDSQAGASASALGSTFRAQVARMGREFDTVRRLALEHGLVARPDLGEGEPEYLFARLSSLAVDPRRHPLPADSRLRLAARFVAAQARGRAPAGRRLAASLLAAVLAVAPPPLAWRLLAWRHNATARPAWLARLAALRARGAGPGEATRAAA